MYSAAKVNQLEIKDMFWHCQIQPTIFAKNFILDVSLDSQYVSDYRLWIRLIKLPACKPPNLLKRDSNASGFLLILLNF